MADRQVPETSDEPAAQDASAEEHVHASHQADDDRGYMSRDGIEAPRLESLGTVKLDDGAVTPPSPQGKLTGTLFVIILGGLMTMVLGVWLATRQKDSSREVAMTKSDLYERTAARSMPIEVAPTMSSAGSASSAADSGADSPGSRSPDWESLPSGRLSPHLSNGELPRQPNGRPFPLRVLAATYGRNVNAPVGDATSLVIAKCSAERCFIDVNNLTMERDPKPGTPKSFDVDWSCGSQEYRIACGPASNEGYVLFFTCDPKFDPAVATWRNGGPDTCTFSTIGDAEGL